MVKAAPASPQQGVNEHPKPQVKRESATPVVPAHPPEIVTNPAAPPSSEPGPAPYVPARIPNVDAPQPALPLPGNTSPAPSIAEPRAAKPTAPKRTKNAVAADILSAGYSDDLWQEFCALPASERRSLSETADPVQMLAFYKARRAFLEPRAYRCTITSVAGLQKPVTTQLSEDEMCWQVRCPNEQSR